MSAGGRVSSADEVEIQLRVNGEAHSLRLDTRTSLLMRFASISA
jgi:hypothetical protein